MKKLNLGGQAVIEGVMMKSKRNIATAVRKPDGKIEIKKQEFISLTERYKLLGIPFIRGVFTLFEMLYIGMKALNYSTKAASDEEEEIGTVGVIFTIILSLILALFIFKFIPLTLTQLFSRVVSVVENRFVFNLIEGVLKILIFVLYVYAISFMKDVKRLFEYHGAEHKTIACFEAGEKLTIKNIKKYSKEHTRCGTSFIALVIIVSIIVYTLIPLNIPFVYKFFFRVLLLPVIAGISYEILKISYKLEHNPVFRFLVKPGVWIQKITTQKPDKKQIEVAIASVEAVLGMENKG